MVSLDIALLAAQALRLLIGCFILSVPLLAVVSIGRPIRSAIQKRFSLSWLWSVLFSAFVLFSALLVVFYFWPSGFQFFNVNDSLPSAILPFEETNFDAVPSAPDSNPILAAFFLALFKIIFSAVVLSFISFPFILIGSLLVDYFSPKKPKKNPTILSYFLACFGCTLLVILLLLAFPWLFAGIAYFIFFS